MNRILNSHQRGFVGIIGLLSLVLAGLFLLVTLKLLPVYLENFSVQKSMDTLTQDAELQKMRGLSFRLAVQKKLQNRFYVNNVQGIDLRKSLLVHRQQGVRMATLNYEVRRPLIANIDAVVKFKHEVQWPQHG